MHFIRSDSIYSFENNLAKEFASPFAIEKYEKEKRFFDNNAWRNQTDQSDPGGMISRRMLWGARAARTPPRKPRMRYVQRVNDRCYYVLELTRACGLFYYDLKKEEEIRLFHREVFAPRGVHVSSNFEIVTTAADEDGSCHVVLLDNEGRQVKQLTSGDCIDENPFIHKGEIYYQSTGIARTREGFAALYAPAEICKLNLESGSLESVKSYPNFDCLLPKTDDAGNVYYIKAPYQNNQVSMKNHFLDLVLFPYRLTVAILAFLNVFSMFFAKRPLKTSGGPDLAGLDLTKRHLHNRVVDIQHTMRKEGKKVAAPSDWKLIRLRNGAEEELATNVVWYDVSPEGKIIHTDGFAVYGELRSELYKSDELLTCVSW
jgi:hypothetical protein